MRRGVGISAPIGECNTSDICEIKTGQAPSLRNENWIVLIFIRSVKLRLDQGLMLLLQDKPQILNLLLLLL